MKDLANFGKSLKKFATDSINDLKVASAHDLADRLRSLLKSGRADMSAKKINDLFKTHNHIGDDGKIVTVAKPADIADKVVVVGDTIMIALTQDEDRWLRADILFGNDVLAELGIKYRS